MENKLKKKELLRANQAVKVTRKISNSGFSFAKFLEEGKSGLKITFKDNSAAEFLLTDEKKITREMIRRG